MTWAEAFPIAAMLLYLGAGIAYAVQGQGGFSLMYFAYAVSNLGLLWAALQGR
jgi:hypothetical protein